MMRITSSLVMAFCLVAVSNIVAQEATEKSVVDEAVPFKGSPMSVRLKNGTTLRGVASGVSEFKMNCIFGETKLPVDQIAGIRIGDQPDTTVVQLKNGDSLTGFLAVEQVELSTSWGSCRINAPNIKEILLAPDVAWTQINGRWKLQPSTGIINRTIVRGRR